MITAKNVLNMSESDESKRLTFYNAIENGAWKISENHNPVYGGYTEINYTLTVKNSCGEHSKWLIVRRMGFSGKCSLPENVPSLSSIHKFRQASWSNEK
jgi:hypothetical protein